MRVGIGYDVHRLGEQGTLRLGGVDVEGAPRLLGHSDGDALLHAITDALLGAAGQGDIGQHFPPGDPATAGIDSRELLRRAARLVAAQRYRVANVDATVMAERPRLAPLLPEMRESIARTLGIEPGRVNVKATTTEGLGEIGRGAAIAAMAVAMLDEDVA
jgi:2-C-methyl-D-erythritol 2,4-cyclodiphosphate synthase